eukprot:TRINITY_DN71625_c0_g1_i1.p1 TRINITY_DN71625_c0_g1~~TRINITY_DN71625_c0_g1_i1.p1  ORF type:complete len:1268 (-),score=122.33 TRINITY_DN71625_c0_g1_i1:277-3549(-)
MRRLKISWFPLRCDEVGAGKTSKRPYCATTRRRRSFSLENRYLLPTLTMLTSLRGIGSTWSPRWLPYELRWMRVVSVTASTSTESPVWKLSGCACTVLSDVFALAQNVHGDCITPRLHWHGKDEQPGTSLRSSSGTLYTGLGCDDAVSVFFSTSTDSSEPTITASPALMNTSLGSWNVLPIFAWSLRTTLLSTSATSFTSAMPALKVMLYLAVTSTLEMSSVPSPAESGGRSSGLGEALRSAVSLSQDRLVPLCRLVPSISGPCQAAMTSSDAEVNELASLKLNPVAMFPFLSAVVHLSMIATSAALTTEVDMVFPHLFSIQSIGHASWLAGGGVTRPFTTRRPAPLLWDCGIMCPLADVVKQYCLLATTCLKSSHRKLEGRETTSSTASAEGLAVGRSSVMFSGDDDMFLEFSMLPMATRGLPTLGSSPQARRFAVLPMCDVDTDGLQLSRFRSSVSRTAEPLSSCSVAVGAGLPRFNLLGSVLLFLSTSLTEMATTSVVPEFSGSSAIGSLAEGCGSCGRPSLAPDFPSHSLPRTTTSAREPHAIWPTSLPNLGGCASGMECYSASRTPRARACGSGSQFSGSVGASLCMTRTSARSELLTRSPLSSLLMFQASSTPCDSAAAISLMKCSAERSSCLFQESSLLIGRRRSLDGTQGPFATASRSSSPSLLPLIAGVTLMSACWTRSGSTRSSAFSDPTSWRPRLQPALVSMSTNGSMPLGTSSRMDRGSVARPPSAVSAARQSQRARRAAQRTRRLAESSDRRQDFLLRRRVGAATRREYDRSILAFQRATQCPSSAPLSVVNAKLLTHLTNLYFAGADVREMRYAYYAVKWDRILENRDLPDAHAALMGYLRENRSKMRDPVTWEETVVTAAESLRGGGTAAAFAAAWQLLTFDLFSRPSDLLNCSGSDLHPPVGKRGSSQFWNVTLFPSTRHKRSKTMRQDDTIPVGKTCHQRRWLNDVVAAFHRSTPSNSAILPVKLSTLSSVMKAARKRLGLPPAVPHQLRHGGASADVALEDLSLLEVQQRGCWTSAASVQRYSKPGRYLRALANLPQSVKDRFEIDLKFLQTSLPAALSPTVRTPKRRRVFP